MMGVQIPVCMLAIIMAYLSFGATQTVQNSDFTCLVRQEFSASLQGLKSIITTSFLSIKRCDGKYIRYCISKQAEYIDGHDNEISFKLYKSAELCSEADTAVYTRRIEAVTKYRIIREGSIQKLELIDEMGQLMMVMIFDAGDSTQMINAATLKGVYRIYLPPLTIRFSFAGTIEIEGCNKYSTTFNLSESSNISFDRLKDIGQCNSDHERLIINAILNSTKLKLNEDCDMTMSRNATTKQLDIVAKPVIRHQTAIVGDYNLYLIGSELDPIRVQINNDYISFTGCKRRILQYSLTAANAINITDFIRTLQKCGNDNDPEYIEAFERVARFEWDGDRQLLRFYDAESNLVYSTQAQDNPPPPPPQQLFPDGRYTLYLVGSELDPVRVAINSYAFLFIGCNNYTTMYSTTADAISFTGFFGTSKACENDNDPEYIQAFDRVTRFKFNSNTQLLRFYDANSNMVYSTQASVQSTDVQNSSNATPST